MGMQPFYRNTMGCNGEVLIYNQPNDNPPVSSKHGLFFRIEDDDHQSSDRDL